MRTTLPSASTASARDPTPVTRLSPERTGMLTRAATSSSALETRRTSGCAYDRYVYPSRWASARSDAPAAARRRAAAKADVGSLRGFMSGLLRSYATSVPRAAAPLVPPRGRLTGPGKPCNLRAPPRPPETVSYTHLRAHETRHDIVCRLLL